MVGGATHVKPLVDNKGTNELINQDIYLVSETPFCFHKKNEDSGTEKMAVQYVKVQEKKKKEEKKCMEVCCGNIKESQ